MLDAEKGEGNWVRVGEMAEGVVLVVTRDADGGDNDGREEVAVMLVRGRKRGR